MAVRKKKRRYKPVVVLVDKVSKRKQTEVREDKRREYERGGRPTYFPYMLMEIDETISSEKVRPTHGFQNMEQLRQCIAREKLTVVYIRTNGVKPHTSNGISLMGIMRGRK